MRYELTGQFRLSEHRGNFLSDKSDDRPGKGGSPIGVIIVGLERQSTSICRDASNGFYAQGDRILVVGSKERVKLFSQSETLAY